MSAAATANRLSAVYGGLDRSGYQLPSCLLHYRRSRGRHSTLSRHFLLLFLLLSSNIRRLPGGVISLPLRLLLIRQGRGEFVFVAHDRRTRRTAIDVAAVAMAANTHGLAATLADVASMAVPVTTTIFCAHWPKWPPGNWTDEASSAIIRLAVIRNCFGGEPTVWYDESGLPSGDTPLKARAYSPPGIPPETDSLSNPTTTHHPPTSPVSPKPTAPSSPTTPSTSSSSPLFTRSTPGRA